MKNNDLKKIYEEAYSNGAEKFFTFSTSDITKEILTEVDWKDKVVLEIGCGLGDTAAEIARAGAKTVQAWDYSRNAIAKARATHKESNLSFEVNSIEKLNASFDVIVMQEVIEHVDDPKDVIQKLAQHLNTKGSLLLTCPSFLNLRGYVWMTLQILFDVPMSLTDKHFISPCDMSEWSTNADLLFHYRTFRHSQSYGELMAIDMQKRLTNALADAQMDNSNVRKLIDWLESASNYESETPNNGSKALYHLEKP